MKIKNNIIKYLIIVIFLIVIFIPQILFFLVKNNIREDNSENRNLADKPELNIDTIQEYPKKFNSYYNDHVPFRGILKTTYSNMIFNVFKTTTIEKVLIGKNDGDKSLTWLFYQDDSDGNPVREAEGYTTFDNEEIETMKSNIVEDTAKAKEKNIELYYIICPNKENIYKQKLPDDIKIYDNESRTDKLVKRLTGDEKITNLIYPKNELEEASKNNNTYLRQDTHWNEYGAFIGTKILINKIQNSKQDYFENVKVEKGEEKIFPQDLSDFAGIKKIFKDNQYNIEFLKNVNYSESIEETADAKSITTTNCNNAIYNKTLMIVGDSYRERMLPYLAKLYTKVVSLHREDYDSNTINKYKPDIIILENVERYINYIKKFKLF